jgi:hypothetical protein
MRDKPQQPNQTMSITPADSKKMKTLVQEGKQISKISVEFPAYSYWEIYFEVYGDGQRSALGVKRMIANRLKKLVNASEEDRKRILEELNGLVWNLYNNHKTNQKKLQEIRRKLGE